MKKIPLTRGKFALVDDEDFEFLSRWTWYPHHGRNTTYAKRGVKIRGKWGFEYMHRCLLSASLVDHINRNGLDNRRKNLRAVSRAQNQWNRCRHNSGIHFTKKFGVNKPYSITLTANGQRFNGGRCFSTREEAARAIKLLKAKHHAV